MLDPTLTHRLTTAAVPEWAAEVTVMVPRVLAEIERLRDENKDLDYAVGWLADAEQKGRERIASLKAELADVKAECCRLVCRNGDLEAEVAALGQVSAAAADFRAEYFTNPRNIHAYTVAWNSLGYALDKLRDKAKEPQ